MRGPDALPPPVRALAARLGVDRGAAHTTVTFEERGRMRQDAASAWMPFRGHQTSSTDRCRFAWVARTGPAGVIRVRDELDDRGGRVRVDLLGVVPLARPAPHPDLTLGELVRYLAEIAWAPGAILANRHLRWAELPDGRLRVAAGEAVTASVTFALDAAGRIGEVFCADRPRAVAGGFEPTPWRGRFSDYSEFSGVWIPRSGAVSWTIDGAEVEVWRGEILDWRAS